MKNILVLVHDDDGQEARLQVAFDIVRAVRGHLTCADIVTVPVFVGDYMGTGGDALLLADEEAREARNAVALKLRLAQEDISYEWVDATGEPSRCLRAAAKLADLIVVNRRLDGAWYPDMSEITGAVVAKGGRPVMAVPQGARRLDLHGNVVIAWDGSDPAAAAMRAAVPLLAFAGSVTLLQVDDGSVTIPATEAARYLSRHGITATVQIEDGRGRKVTDVVRTVLASRNASYLVMGGFDHPRWLESIFGGVTATMIDHTPIPILLAH